MLNLNYRATGFYNDAVGKLKRCSELILVCKHVTEFAGVMLGSRLLVKITYPVRNPIGRIVQSWHAYMRRD